MRTIINSLIMLMIFTIGLDSQGLTIGSGATFSLGSATLFLPGNWNNAGTFFPGTGTVTLNGTSNQTITNASGETFLDLNVQKPSGDVVLNNDITINGNLTLTNGDLDLNGHIITLGATALLNETAGNTVKGISGVITTTRDLGANPGNVAGLGVNISSSPALGSTVIERGHRPDTIGTSNSIRRYYKITPTNNSGLNATASFYYDDSELNNLTEAYLGLYKSTDNGLNWLAVEGTLNTTGNYFIATNIESFSKWSLFSTTNPPSDVEEKKTAEKESPEVYALGQNYPNPFNAVTTIAYEVASAEQVTLIIYNTLGQEVARLVNERKSAGRYEVRWDASNMPTGVYFYRLTAGSFTATRKLLLVK